MREGGVGPGRGARGSGAERMGPAAGSQGVSRDTTRSCGSRRWSIAPTVQPSGSSQILRKCLPSTFMTHPSTRYDLTQPRLDQIVAVSFCLSMAFFGKPVSTFPDHPPNLTRGKPARPPVHAFSLAPDPAPPVRLLT